MTSNEDFDWELLELEDKRNKKILTEKEYLKLGYKQEDLDQYNSTTENLIKPPVKESLIKGTIFTVTSAPS